MKTMLCFAMLLVLMVSGAVAGDRLALVIGNQAYARISGPSTARNDARLVATTLRSLGFDVTERTDLDARDMRQAIDALGHTLRRSPEGSIAIVYFSGGARQLAGDTHLLPVDFGTRSGAGNNDAGIALGRIVDRLLTDQASLKVVICDVTGAGTAPFDASDSGSLPRNTILALASNSGDPEMEPPDVNGSYAIALARALQQRRKDMVTILQDARTDMHLSTRSGNMPARMFSVDRRWHVDPAQAGPSLSIASIIGRDFDRTRALNTKTAWRAYIDRYGRNSDALFHVTLARVALDSLAAN